MWSHVAAGFRLENKLSVLCNRRPPTFHYGVLVAYINGGFSRMRNVSKLTYDMMLAYIYHTLHTKWAMYTMVCRFISYLHFKQHLCIRQGFI